MCTVAVTSNPGSKSQTSTFPSATTSHQRAAFGLDVAEPQREHGALPRPRVHRHLALHVPQQQVRVEVLLAELADPADAPLAQRVTMPESSWPLGVRW